MLGNRVEKSGDRLIKRKMLAGEAKGYIFNFLYGEEFSFFAKPFEYLAVF